MKLFLTLLILFAIFHAVRLCVCFYKRLRAHLRFLELQKQGKFKLRFTRSFLASLFKMSHAPDLCAEIADKIYLIRYYNGRGGSWQVHFANEEYSVRFKVLLIRSLFAVGGRLLSGHSRSPQSTTTAQRQVKIVPKLEIPREYKDAQLFGKTIVPILVFNPAPAGISYVSDEKTSIKLAFTGDEFRGIKIFSASSCANFLEREQRYSERNDF